MAFCRGLLALALIALLMPVSAGAQQRPPPKPRTDDYTSGEHPLDQMYYRKEMMEEYRKELERYRRMREMEAWDNQRRLVKRKLLNVRCTWKRPDGKTLTKVFKQRVASSCKDAIAELSSDLGKTLSADCTCTGASPTSKNP